MKMKKNLWFTLVEILIVISIMSIVSIVWVNSFYSYIDFQELEDKIYVINRDLKEIDDSVKSYKISDYELYVSKWLWYYYYSNYYNSDKKQTISIDFNSWIWIIKNSSLSDYLYIKVLSNNYNNSYNIKPNNSFTWTFLDSINYKITWTSSWYILNNIILNYFWDENLGYPKNDDNLLKIDEINTKEDKSWSKINLLIIKNTWKWKELCWDWAKIDEVYLFFSKKWKEDKLRIFTK